MPHEPKEDRVDKRSWLYSIALHTIVVVLIFAGIGFSAHLMTAAPGTGRDTKPVKATVVSQKLIDQQVAQIKAAKAKRKAAQEAAERKHEHKLEAMRKARKREQQRLAELKHKRQTAAKQAARAKAEAEVAQEKAAAAQKKAAAEAAARKQAAEEAAARKAAAAKAAAQRKKQLQQELAAEQARRKKAAAKAQAAAQRSQAMGNYVAAIKQKVIRNWIVPPTTPDDLRCVVNVTQVPGGEVVDAKIGTCNADKAVQQSIVSAVYKASPFPEPSDKGLFERQIKFTFTQRDVSE